MGTPTATIPAWLAAKYPDIVSEFEGGKKRTFGGRHVYCFNSSRMYEYSEKIIRKLVEHYKEETSIVACRQIMRLVMKAVIYVIVKTVRKNSRAIFLKNLQEILTG